MKWTETTIQNKLQQELEGPQAWVVPNYTPPNWWECDLLAISKSGYAQEFEIKISRADFKNDFKKEKKASWSNGFKGSNKHEELARHSPQGPKFFWYVCPEGILLPDEMPEYAGLRYITRYRSRVMKKAPQLHKHKFSQQAIDKFGRMFYYRLWSARARIQKLNKKLAVAK